MNALIVFAGPSGSGKDSVVDELARRHPNWKKLLSCTTREKRYFNESTHIFCSAEDYSADKINGNVIAETRYNNNIYWSNKDQVDASTLYVVDVKGVKDLRNNYKNKRIIAVGLSVSPATAEKRMKMRGDSPEKIKERLAYDSEAFNELSDVCDATFAVDDMSIDDVATLVEAFISVILLESA